MKGEKYIYRLPVSVEHADGWLHKAKSGSIKISTGSPGFVSRNPIFHFTDEEVEGYAEGYRKLFEACEKERVE